jgi:hypothetical protein
MPWPTKQEEVARLVLRVPMSLKRFIEREAAKGFTSQNTEILKSIAERKARIEKAEHDRHAA